VGGDLEPETLIHAYSRGVFPWPHEGYPLLWFCPVERAILQFDQLHIGRSLERAKKQTTLRFTVDQAFVDVITACGETERPGQDGTWITPDMKAAYIRLHQLGHAHSVEAWRGALLVAGVYGVDAGGPFSAESMFHRETNASKLTLLYLIEHLQKGGLDWMDVQVMTPHIERLGARLIGRGEFLKRLKQTQSRGLHPFALK
jgi:leucyl/phenylalanyl-tRNA--protein transferase